VADQLIFLIVVGTAVWVGFDAQELQMRKGRLGGGCVDMGPRSWVVSCLLLWIVALPCYLVARARYVALRDGPLTPVAMPASPFTMSATRFGVQVSPFAAAPAPAPVVVPMAAAEVQAAPPQLSADGYWWWDGSAWTPAATAAVGQG
jgi:hypothetical protein